MKRNVPEGYTATLDSVKPSVQVKGVASNINSINDIKGYVDLAGLGEGTHQVEVKIENNNPLVNYVVSATVSVVIKKD